MLIEIEWLVTDNDVDLKKLTTILFTVIFVDVLKE